MRMSPGSGLNEPIGAALATIWLCVNLVGFFAMGIDKLRAVRGGHRIPERHFFLLSALGGGSAVALGIIVFRHKLRKISFKAGIGIAFGLHLGCLALIGAIVLVSRNHPI